MANDMFSFDNGQAPVKLGCGHFGTMAESSEFRGKRICAKCAKLVLKDGGDNRSKKEDGAKVQAPQGKSVVGQSDSGSETEGEAQDSGNSEAEGDAEGQGQPQDAKGDKGKGEAKEGNSPPPQGNQDDDSPVMHSELPAILAPINAGLKDHKTKLDLQAKAITVLGQRMDGGQKEIELAKAAFDSHEVRITALDQLIGKGLGDRIEALEAQRAKVIKIYQNRDDKSPVVLEGLHHAQFALLLQTCTARLPDGNRMNVWLRGPAGSGKTTAAANVAKALGLQFAFNGALDSEYKLKGFVDATGKCVSTPFRKIWTEGGVYLFDEVDASLPSAVLSFNAALANGACDFPDANIPRHKDCVIIAAANTFGGGATADYVGRAKQDAAFLDRFIQMNWDIDENLETALTGNASWSSYVQGARSKVAERGLKGIIISPRASLFGASMLAQGIAASAVVEMTIYKGMTQDQRKALALPTYKA